MAQQKGVIKLGGTLGDLTFYKTKDGYFAREKGGISGERIASDPAFQRTRENGAEFGRAGRAGRVLRSAFRGVLQNASDRGMSSRLTALMLKVIQADAVSPRGLRNVIDGEAELLLGFEFNAEGKLGASLHVPFTCRIDRAAGTLEAIIPSYIPSDMISAPGGATHYRLASAGAAVDFEKETFVSDSATSPVLPWNSVPVAELTLSNTVGAGSRHPLFLVLGIEFYQEVNRQMYPLKNGSHNAMALIGVNGSGNNG